MSSLTRPFVFGVLVVALVVVVSRSASAQMLPPAVRTVELAGPRFGFTVLPDSIVDELAERDIRIRPYITQFGWQFERQFFTRDSGTTMVTELVTMLGGLEQNTAIPSLSWLVGIRTRDGFEVGIGPNLSPTGSALVFAGGVTVRTGLVNVPLNVAVVPSRGGTRITVVTGFSMRRR